MSNQRTALCKRPARLYATLGGDGEKKRASRRLHNWGYVSLNDRERAFVLVADATTGEFVLKIHKIEAITQAGPVLAENPTVFMFRKEG